MLGKIEDRAAYNGAPAAFINLDAAANAEPTRQVIDAVLAALTSGAANPSSAHGLGDISREILAQARDAVVALLIGAFEESVTFTSGCTEANNTVFAGAGADTIVTTVIEHPSVLRAAERAASGGATVHYLPVDRNGIVDLARLPSLLQSAQGSTLVSVQYANSETGVIQPVEQIAALVLTRPDTTFHSDAAQAFGKVAIDLSPGIGPDVITISGHKLHAPMGVGAIVSSERAPKLSPLLVGGDQESSLRAGTEPVALIAGFGAACCERFASFAQVNEQMSELRDRLEAGLLRNVPFVSVGAFLKRLPNISSVRFARVDAMSLVAHLDGRGVAISQGSACSSRRPEPSHVLTAMGLTEEEAFETVRFSLSSLNSASEVDAAISIIAETAELLRSVSWAPA